MCVLQRLKAAECPDNELQAVKAPQEQQVLIHISDGHTSTCSAAGSVVMSLIISSSEENSCVRSVFVFLLQFQCVSSVSRLLINTSDLCVCVCVCVCVCLSPVLQVSQQLL